MAGIASAAIIGGLGVGGSLLSGLIGSSGARGASAQAQAAGQQAYNSSQAQIDRNTSNASPYTATGINALSTIGSLLGYGTLSNPGGEGGTYNYTGDPTGSDYTNALSQVQGLINGSGATQPTLTNYQFTPETATSNTFTSDPGYAFRLQQGITAQDQSAASKGTLLSGAQQQALTDYGQNMATQDYQQWLTNYQNQNNYNTSGQLATNSQNFGQQQQVYSNTTSAYNNALNYLNGLAGMGNTATTAEDNANTGATSSGGSALTGSANTAAGYTNAAANDTASSVGSAANNALYAYLLGSGGTGGGGSSYNINAAKAAYNTGGY